MSYFNRYPNTEQFTVAISQIEDKLQARVISYLLGEEDIEDIPNLVSLYSTNTEREAYLISKKFNSMIDLGIKISCIHRIARAVRIEEE